MGVPDELLSLGLRDIIAGTIAAFFAGTLIVGINTFFAMIVSGDDVSELGHSLVRVLVPSGILLVLYALPGVFDNLNVVRAPTSVDVCHDAIFSRSTS
jgi:hypothetical protein